MIQRLSSATRRRSSLDDLFVWADVCSIPQRNAGIKGLSIVSLPAYAGASDFFVAIVPEACHADSCARPRVRGARWPQDQVWRRAPARGLAAASCMIDLASKLCVGSRLRLTPAR